MSSCIQLGSKSPGVYHEKIIWYLSCVKQGHPSVRKFQHFTYTLRLRGGGKRPVSAIVNPPLIWYRLPHKIP